MELLHKPDFDKVKKPICAICKKPVEEFGEYHNHSDSFQRHFYIKCHGEVETASLTFHQLLRFERGDADLFFGEAFTTKKITG